MKVLIISKLITEIILKRVIFIKDAPEQVVLATSIENIPKQIISERVFGF